MHVRNLTDAQKTFGMAAALVLAGFVAFLVLGWLVLPKLSYETRMQPVDDNHPLHVEKLGLACDTCHFFHEDGSWAGLPALEICADCHEEPIGTTPAEIRFVNEYVKRNREPKWAIYNRQPECVSFSHSSHVRMASISCQTCHGPQGYSDVTEYHSNRITNYSYVMYDSRVPLNAFTIMSEKGKKVWGTMRMDECASCHRARGTSTACFICHK
ncbi:MAG: cytochrome C [Candidatus Abyssobacteria bacterium SURF_5]|uniref:Cytochrome C n=1 Tax=Abyssobacteria bacterium (strain SURF_5) TaxID=2093360 RepID=A0A3A4PD92_ABYX5|nr:MAG: cytochrome C [Candidatus Abyssubacteria bacterium SURF_5]